MDDFMLSGAQMLLINLSNKLCALSRHWTKLFLEYFRDYFFTSFVDGRLLQYQST